MPGACSGVSALIHAPWGGAGTYDDRVLGYNPLAYYPMTETSGPTAVELVHGWDGTYTGVSFTGTGPDGRPCPRFDGVNDFLDVDIAALKAALDGREGAHAIWMRVFNAAVWTDGIQRYAWHVYTDVQNKADFYKSNINNRIDFWYEANNVSEFAGIGRTETTWLFVVMDYSLANDRVIYYIYENGVQLVAQTHNTLGTYAGGVLTTLIGAINAAGGSAFNGWLARAMVFDAEQGAAVWNDLAVV